MVRLFARLGLASVIVMSLLLPGVHALAQQGPAASGSYEETALWDSTEPEAHENYHVQGLAVLPDDTVLAFAEGRHTSCDAGPHDIVMRRSTDGGDTYEPSRILVPAANGEAWGNPTPVVDEQSGKVFLFFGDPRQDEGNTTCSPDRSELFVMESSDSGETWSEPRNLTRLFDGNAHDWVLHAAGPGHGLQLDDGRLLMPVWHRRPIVGHTTPERMYGVGMVYSDDGGESWQAGEPVPVSQDYPINENRIHQRADGTVVVHGRAASGGTGYRITAVSDDNGTTWSPPTLDGATGEQVAIDTGLLRYSGGPGSDEPSRLIYSRPDSSARENMTLSVSYDEGHSYRYSKVVLEGPSYYSDLGRLSDGTILLLYGRDGASASFPERISMARFDLAWLTEGRDSDARGPGIAEQAQELAGQPGTTTAPGTGAEDVADLNARGGKALAYAARGAGDWVEVPFRTPAAGTYELGVRFQRAPDRGRVRVAVDGRDLPAGLVDPTLTRLDGYQVYSFGSTELTAGDHRIRFTLDAAGRAGGTVLAPDHLTLLRGGEPADAPRTIADNDSSFSFQQAAGQWSRATGSPGYYGQSYHTHPAGDGSAVARWRPDVPYAGRYEVQVRYAADANRASNAPYTVHHEDGSSTVRVDQRSGGGSWVPLGTYRFIAGTAGSVELTDAADGYVIADAVRLVRAE